MIEIFILIIFLIIIIKISKTPWGKGKIGEFFINSINDFSLDKKIYKTIKDVTLKAKDESTTQIDHIIISKYGIFVIETKNYKGWIFGNENQKEWTQQLFKKKHKFQNPIHQNYKHIKVLEEVLNSVVKVDIKKFISVVVFIGEAELKKVPDGVFKGTKYIKYIKLFEEEILKENEIRTIQSILERKKEKRGILTDMKHVQSLNERHNKYK